MSEIIPVTENEILLPYQQNYLNDKSPMKTVEKSRQIGFTWVQALEDVLDIGIEQLCERSYLSSKDISSIELYMDYCKFWAKRIGIAMEDIGVELIDVDRDVSARCMRFKHGGKIYGTSSSTGALRGKNGKINLDEFAFHKDDTLMWDSAEPATTWGFPLREFSSHNGKGTLFYEHCTGGKLPKTHKKYFPTSVHTVTLYDAVRQGMLSKIRKRHVSKEEQNEWMQFKFQKTRGLKNITWTAPDGTRFIVGNSAKQEYLCMPVDESTAFMSYDFINTCVSDNILFDTLDKITGDLYVGMDIGRKRNLTVIWVCEELGDTLYTRKVIELEKTRFRLQKEVLYSILKHPKFRRCCIDATGIGFQLAEEAREEFGDAAVEDIMFTAKVKEFLAEGLHRSMQERKFLLHDDDNTIEDFHSIETEVTISGHVRYVAKVGDDDSHADRFWSAALCKHASKSEGFIEPSFTRSYKSAERKLAERYGE
jgi:phage FluMu gp28-like protein